MKVTVFGASGRTGRHLVQQALAEGHQVTAFTRSPAKLAGYGDQVRVVEGDVQDAAAVDEAVAGADAVLSVLGPAENVPEYQVTQGMNHILAAMEKHGVRRLILSAGAGVMVPGDEPTVLNRAINVLLNLVSRHVYEDMKRAVTVVRSSDVDWTIVRVPRLVDNKSGAIGSAAKVQVGYVGKGMGMTLARADLAAFILQQLQSDAYVRQAPAISN